jgi:hypothetical protein
MTPEKKLLHAIFGTPENGPDTVHCSFCHRKVAVRCTNPAKARVCSLNTTTMGRRKANREMRSLN